MKLKYRDAEGKESDVKGICAYVKEWSTVIFRNGEYNEKYINIMKQATNVERLKWKWK